MDVLVCFLNLSSLKGGKDIDLLLPVADCPCIS